MSGFCPSLSPDGPFLRDMLGYIDCQAVMIGQGGYQALATPGSVTARMLTGVLTLFVALFGYRLLLGRVPGPREGVLAFVKIGIVLMLATNWPAYRTLIYDVVLRAPGELSASVAGSASLADAANGALTNGLQRIDDELAVLQKLGAGNPQFASQTSQAGAIAPPQGPLTLPWNPQYDRQLIGTARIIYLVATIAAFGSVRMIGGTLLALGPLFMLFLLFGATRGLLEGWIRALFGAALGALATAIVLATELALIEPWLPTIVAQRQAEISTPTLPTELVTVMLVFALLLIAVLVAAARVAHGFHFPPVWTAATERWFSIRTTADGFARNQQDHQMDSAAPQSRAQAVADAIAASQHREMTNRQVSTAATAIERASTSHREMGTDEAAGVRPIGQSYRRRTQGRVSMRAGKRDNFA